MIIEHMEHIISVVGEDLSLLALIYGAIRPPRDIVIHPYPRMI